MNGLQARLLVSDELRGQIGVQEVTAQLEGRFAYAPEIKLKEGEPASIDDLTIVTGKPIGPGFVEVAAARVDEFDQRYVWVTLKPLAA